jgi:DNA-binding response OmpR family regulator
MQGRILIIEDQDPIRAQIAEALAELGCELVQAKDGPAGLRALQQEGAFDLLVTDVGLPGLNGRQIADAARAIHPGLPVLLITGFAGKALEDLELPAGMELMRKPFALEELAARVRALLDPRASAAENAFD